ncbi:adenine phosphoribosyltransferase [Williamsoniiplasma lucivorax]|uniref:Adenine phosphoribosyltransferase n=1 Tax=Williamsoniiplasma lucivorax TaxID=209274 RepID=A0A2S5RD06_9MOLU|nr:adenine phosphoribosyltransferase [Williamsoniiplasma lucivorax]PPE05188.1 adenine phosphoribosyltransferase [Williamsoniiplasma lucivorax]
MIDIKKYILDVEDFPQQGINFKDITPILNHPAVFQEVIDRMAAFVLECQADVIIAPEARGFLFASAIAYQTHKKFVLIRKPGKLPRATHHVSYDLEYGSNILEMHQDDIQANEKVVIIDDILATGGTIEAIVKLVELSHGQVVGLSVVGDLTTLHSPNLLKGLSFQALVKY